MLLGVLDLLLRRTNLSTGSARSNITYPCRWYSTQSGLVESYTKNDFSRIVQSSIDYSFSTENTRNNTSLPDRKCSEQTRECCDGFQSFLSRLEIHAARRLLLK